MFLRVTLTIDPAEAGYGGYSPIFWLNTRQIQAIAYPRPGETGSIIVFTNPDAPRLDVKETPEELLATMRAAGPLTL